MNNVSKEELTKFVNHIENFDNAKHTEKILAFGYYITNVVNAPYFDNKVILLCYQLLDDIPPVNISDSLKKLKDIKKLVSADGGYRLHRTEANKLEYLKKLFISENASDVHSVEGKSDFSKSTETQQKSKHEKTNTAQITNAKHSTLSEINSDEKYFDKTKANESLVLIRGFDTLQLPKFRVVGNYVRFDDDVRNELKNMKQRIIEGLEPNAEGNENYLIWGPPGSGKSYFVNQIAESIGDSVCYLELNLTKLTQDQFCSSLAKLEKIGKRCICLVDEVDSESTGKWAYATMLTHLLPSSPRKFRICFILAGSGGSNIEEMKKKISLHNKGKDFLSRIPTANEYIIPLLGVGDNLLVGTSQLMATARKLHPEINAVEKLALFYIAVYPQFTSARQISELVSRSIRRIPTGEDRIKYDHLFNPGELINKEFYQKAMSLDASLANSFILVEDDV